MSARLLLALLLLLVPHGAFGEQLQLPVPPEQELPWVAPESVPTNLLSTATTLFAQGFPDPRGCEYRQITVEVSNERSMGRGFWGRANPMPDPKAERVQTTGWLLPASGSQTQRFAICWNGLIYPVVELGAPADLLAEAALPSRADGNHGFHLTSEELRSVYSTNAGSSRVLLLLRSGQTGAALAQWQSLGRPRQPVYPVVAGSPEPPYDPYLNFAGDWAWALFDWAVCAHMRGDEALALATARALSEVQLKIEAEAARRGFPRPRDYNNPRHTSNKPYLAFLEPLPQLLTDLERREREGARVPVLESGLTNMPPAERIPALIRDLDLVALRPWGQPNGAMLAQTPVVAALIAEGDPAVAALIDCLATDQRLTRSVRFGGDFSRTRNLIPVTSAAKAALQVILQTDFPNAAGWRAYWQRFHGMRIEERWFALLQDDSAGMGRWLETAASITQPDNVASVPGTGDQFHTATTSNAPVALRGEWLRTKAQPSVSELLARRALEISPTNAAGYDLGTASDICLRLAVWDPAAAGPVATALVRREQTVAEYSDPGAQREHGEERFGKDVARLTTMRANTGEAGALEDYAAWLPTVAPQSLGGSLAESLGPLIAFSTNAVMQSLAGKMFSETNSSWGKLPWQGQGYFNPIESGLVQLPAFRLLLGRELDLKTVCGSWEWRPGMVSYQLTNVVKVSGSWTLELPDAEQPAAGAKVELRWCDWIAFNLAKAKQIPTFNPFAPPAQRDEAVGIAQARLRAESVQP